ncbi:MAG: hypothetical protein GEU73_12355 [Chloroflexi bacterium]|nr:hypothetical protein [Chloroflexota bacterium]
MGGHLITFFGAFEQQWKQSARAEGFRWIQRLPPAFLIGWVAAQSGDPRVVTYVAIGVFLMQVWSQGVFDMGWSLQTERFMGTFELQFAARSPLMVVMLGKATALAVVAAQGGLASTVLVLIMARTFLSADQLAVVVPSFVLAMIALLASSFVFMPLMVLARGGGGFFEAIRPFGIVFGGFLAPVSKLPLWLQPVAWALPSSWAMGGLVASTEQPGALAAAALFWSLALGISAVYLLAAMYLFRIIERKVLRDGTLTGI